MRSWAFLASRRWVVFALVVVLLAGLAWWLGEWQFQRLEERRARNAVIERNQASPPVPVTEVLSPARELPASREWRTVTATGRYLEADTVIVRYRTRDGASGIEVVVPLLLDGGTAVLVDRGWLATDNRGGDVADVPSPPGARSPSPGGYVATRPGTARR